MPWEKRHDRAGFDRLHRHGQVDDGADVRRGRSPGLECRRGGACLYAKGGAAVEPIGAAFPGVVVDGAIDRMRLAEALGRDDQAFQNLEQIVHPLVAQGRYHDLAAARAQGVKLAILDIPLLFETGGDAAVDAVVVVTAEADIQAERVLSRPGMTRERFDAILERQTPDAEKRRRADFIVDTGQGLEAARARVAEIVGTVLDPAWTPPSAPLSPAAEAPH